ARIKVRLEVVITLIQLEFVRFTVFWTKNGAVPPVQLSPAPIPRLTKLVNAGAPAAGFASNITRATIPGPRTGKLFRIAVVTATDAFDARTAWLKALSA